MSGRNMHKGGTRRESSVSKKMSGRHLYKRKKQGGIQVYVLISRRHLEGGGVKAKFRYKSISVNKRGFLST